jgi:hypothetical protein
MMVDHDMDETRQLVEGIGKERPIHDIKRED